MNIIPQPLKTVKLNGCFTIDADVVVYCHAEYADEVRVFTDFVSSTCGFQLQVTQNIEEAQIIFNHNARCLPNQYLIMINEGLATITAYDKVSCFYAVQTLLGISVYSKATNTLSLANCYVEDCPKFAYRGLMVDLCRHFFLLETLLKVVDEMARVKLNKLHLHLSDDQGFRVEISKYPLLNSVGSVRGGSEVIRNGERFVDDQVHQGYLTKQDVAHLVSYAAERKIDVIPELSLPGRVLAMLAAYPQYSCVGQIAEVRKKWTPAKDVLCVGNDETLPFVCDILDEITQMFPSPVVHLGGNDVPQDRWCNCKACLQKMSDLHLDGFEDLHRHFVEQVRLHLQEKGKRVVCWEDEIDGADDSVICQCMRSRNRAVAQANKGRKVILSPSSHFNFGWPYSRVPIEKTRAFKPLKGVKKGATDNVLGVEGLLWTEYVQSEEKLFFQLLPRVNALAEVAWGYKGVHFADKCKQRYADYAHRQLACNDKATAKTFFLHRHAVTNKFYKFDSDVELLGK